VAAPVLFRSTRYLECEPVFTHSSAPTRNRRQLLLPTKTAILLAVIALIPLPAAGQTDRSLLIAAKKHNRAEVQALVEQGAPVGASEADGTTALHWASYWDDVESAQLLIDTGADIDAMNDLGATPLWVACENGSHVMARTLLAAGADPNAALRLGETPLMVASRSGAPRVVEQLLAKGADVGARAARGQTALMWAVSQHHADVVDVLLDHGADPHARSDVWTQVMAVPPHARPEHNFDVPHGGNTALMFAARVGDLASARLLVSAGANVNDTDAWGVSATVLASHSGYVELVEFLLESGADANVATAGFAALHEAVMRGDERMVTALLTHGADPNVVLQTWTPKRRDSRDFNFSPSLVGSTPFWLAARFAQPAVMRRLVEYGADSLFIHDVEYLPDGYDISPRREATTALMAAVGMGGRRLRAWIAPDPSQLETQVLASVKLAVECGVAVNAVDLQGRTALDGATAQGYTAVIEFLIEHGAKPGSI